MNFEPWPHNLTEMSKMYASYVAFCKQFPDENDYFLDWQSLQEYDFEEYLYYDEETDEEINKVKYFTAETITNFYKEQDEEEKELRKHIGEYLELCKNGDGFLNLPKVSDFEYDVQSKEDEFDEEENNINFGEYLDVWEDYEQDEYFDSLFGPDEELIELICKYDPMEEDEDIIFKDVIFYEENQTALQEDFEEYYFNELSLPIQKPTTEKQIKQTINNKLIPEKNENVYLKEFKKQFLKNNYSEAFEQLNYLKDYQHIGELYGYIAKKLGVFLFTDELTEEIENILENCKNKMNKNFEFKSTHKSTIEYILESI